MSYIDGFVIPVPAARKQAYLAMATQAAAILKECVATRVVECWGDDLPDAKITGFKLAVKTDGDENVVFSWSEWPSKAARDEGNAKFMKDPRMQAFKAMPFEGKRMIFGGSRHCWIRNIRPPHSPQPTGAQHESAKTFA